MEEELKEELVVKKWWGENAAELNKSPQNVVSDFVKWIKQAIVVSAIRSPDFNTTDNLIELAELLELNNKEKIYSKINEIKDFHINIIKEKNLDSPKLIKEVKNFFDENLIKKIKNYLSEDNKININKKNDYSINNWDKTFSLIWFWEELSAFIQAKLINNLEKDWLEAEVVDLEWITDWLDSDIVIGLAKSITERVSLVLNDGKVPIISWYIPGFESWIENVIWRWYTDANAAMLSIWFSESYKTTLEIQKSVDWILSIDPRILENWKAQLIEQMDYLTAKEITWVRGSQAKLLHSQVLRKELLKAWIDVKLFNPFGESKGTIISKNKNPNSNWVEYIWARENVIFFSISSWEMSDSGILSSIFEVVKKYNISVDIVSTSETEISFTIDDNVEEERLKSLSNDIRKKIGIRENDDINFVKYEKDKALIFCIWQNLKHSVWALARATKVLQEANINSVMVSQWSMERCIVFWIEEKDMKKAANLLHKEFI